MKTFYEWDVETLDANGDVQDHDHESKLKAHRQYGAAILSGKRNDLRLVLVRDVGSDDDGVAERAWAYVKDGKLPDEFDDGTPVPQRFHIELNSAYKKKETKQ
jgi:hypothetical protein|tara:strand:+ start:469 stop:777 length:309 start_codon:yes stop_codon:yes gene_type:complete